MWNSWISGIQSKVLEWWINSPWMHGFHQCNDSFDTWVHVGRCAISMLLGVWWPCSKNLTSPKGNYMELHHLVSRWCINLILSMKNNKPRIPSRDLLRVGSWCEASILEQNQVAKRSLFSVYHPWLVVWLAHADMVHAKRELIMCFKFYVFIFIHFHYRTYTYKIIRVTYV